MFNIKRILFPIDFSERCCSAVPFVQSVARRFGAKITLLSVGSRSTTRFSVNNDAWRALSAGGEMLARLPVGLSWTY